MIEKRLSPLKNFTLLLVDDDKQLLDNLKDTLTHFFGDIITSTNGVEAFMIFQNQKIDIVMTDYVMPILDGYSLCKKIRDIDSDVPLFILSNYSETDKLLKSIQLNLISYIVKPVQYSDLVESLIFLIERLEKTNSLQTYLSPNVVFNSFAKTLTVDNKNVKLSKTEITLLELFIKNKNSIVTHDMIDYALKKDKPLTTHAIKNIIYRIKLKTGLTDFITNVQSLGYIYHISSKQIIE